MNLSIEISDKQRNSPRELQTLIETIKRIVGHDFSAYLRETKGNFVYRIYSIVADVETHEE